MLDDCSWRTRHTAGFCKQQGPDSVARSSAELQLRNCRTVDQAGIRRSLSRPRLRVFCCSLLHFSRPILIVHHDIFSPLKGKTAVELAKPESAVRSLLDRYYNADSRSEINGLSNDVQSARATSPEVESVFSLEEVNFKNLFHWRSIFFHIYVPPPPPFSDQRFFAVYSHASTSRHHRRPSQLALAATQEHAAASRPCVSVEPTVDHIVCWLHAAASPVILLL